MTELDWPPAGDAHASTAYARYAEIYDALFSDLDDDAAFYVGAARSYLPAGRKMLEIGVGTGRLTARLLEDGHRVVGIDESREMLDRAAEKFRGDDRLELVRGDIRNVELPSRFSLAIAPYGMVAHLLSDDDRRAAYRTVHAHLEPGGTFIFDDCPNWLGSCDDRALQVVRVRDDPNGEGTIRLMTNTIEISGQPLSVRYDFIDRLDRSGRVLKRTIVRIVFRNIALGDELQLLKEAGFQRIEVFGGFDERPLDLTAPAGSRLVLRCHRET